MEEEVKLQNPAVLPIENGSKMKGQSVDGWRTRRQVDIVALSEEILIVPSSNFGKLNPLSTYGSVLSLLTQDKL